MSIVVALHSEVSHAYIVSDFSIQNSVLSEFPNFCTNSHFQGREGCWVKARRVFWVPALSLLSKEKAKQWSYLFVSAIVNY